MSGISVVQRRRAYGVKGAKSCSFYIDADLLQEMNRLAASEHSSRSNLVNEAVREFVDRRREARRRK